MPQLGITTVESFDTDKPLGERTYHVRRKGRDMQPTICGQLHARRGDRAYLRMVAPESICQRCLYGIEVAT
jgi:hypothetical protein